MDVRLQMVMSAHIDMLRATAACTMCLAKLDNSIILKGESSFHYLLTLAFHFYGKKTSYSSSHTWPMSVFLPEQVVYGPRWTINLAFLLHLIPLHTIQQQVPCLSKLALVSNNFGSPITGLRNSSALTASIFRTMRIVFLST